MCSSLPLDILTQLSALGAALVEQVRTHQGATLETLEAAVRTTLQAAVPGLLGAVVQLATPDLDAGLAIVHRRCPGCARLTPMHSARPRTVRTTCGPLTVRRPWYHCTVCRHGFSPADATLALPARARISPALEAWLVRLTVSVPQRDAAALLTDLTGLVVGMDTLREHTTAVGTALADAEDAASVQVQAPQAPAEAVVPAPGTLAVEADGVMVHYTDGWHEAKVGVVGGVVDGELTAASYVAARESVAAFGPRLLAEAARRGALEVVRWEGPLTRPGLAVLRPVHVIGDGAAWIWTLAADHFGERTEVVDVYHAAEHLWTVARALYGEQTTAARVGAEWAVRVLHLLGGEAVRQVLTAARVDATTAAAQEVLRVERGYFTTHAHRMDYPAMRAQNLPIGSGAVESSAKHLVQVRMKRPGQRWSPWGGRAMLTLRARAASGRPLRLHASSDLLQH